MNCAREPTTFSPLIWYMPAADRKRAYACSEREREQPLPTRRCLCLRMRRRRLQFCFDLWAAALLLGGEKLWRNTWNETETNGGRAAQEQLSLSLYERAHMCRAHICMYICMCERAAEQCSSLTVCAVQWQVFVCGGRSGPPSLSVFLLQCSWSNNCVCGGGCQTVRWRLRRRRCWRRSRLNQGYLLKLKMKRRRTAVGCCCLCRYRWLCWLHQNKNLLYF